MLQSMLCQNAPQPRMAGGVCKCICVVHGGGLEQVPCVPQAARLIHNHELRIWLVRLLHQVVDEDSGDLQVVEGAQVGAAGHRLLRVQTSAVLTRNGKTRCKS
eukprot:1158916-Pelagomonas_calceolata.AAC.11